MILGLGMDVCALDRIRRSWERFGYRFAQRILHPEELRHLPASPVAYLAARFAAKEAAVKALGTGFSHGIGFQDIQIVPLDSGRPTLVLHGEAACTARRMGATRYHVSLSHERNVACAVVILEA